MKGVISVTILNRRLTTEQQRLVETNLDLVAKVLRNQIRLNTSNPDMSWDELYQTGCLALCKAALYYDAERPFGPYAARAIRNALFDYSSKTTAYHKALSPLEELSELPSTADPLEHLLDSELSLFLQKQHQDASGAVQKGIYSLVKKAQGYTSADISKDFGVSSNLVRAWMSLAAKKLRQEPELYKLLA